jgi:6-pyruvoyl-tetrahydropterin synthase
MTTTLTVRVEWDAAHRMSSACYAANRRLHGHRYTAEIEFAGTPDERGVLLDVEDARCVAADAVAPWEHRTILRCGDELAAALDALVIEQEPVMEVLATRLLTEAGAQLRRRCPASAAWVSRVRVSSQPDAYAEVRRG